jgi:LPXTG-motif cell wall-anchored protein
MAMSSVLGPWIRPRHGYAIAVVLTATAFAAAGPAAADATPTSPGGGDGRAGSKPTVVLVHDGAVISSAASGNPQVQSLVYISAFRPDKGEVLGISATAFVDKAIGPDVQRFEAKRARPHPVEVNSSHVATISRPDAVTDLILGGAGAQSPAKPTLAETGSRTRDLTAVGGVAVATVLAGAGLFAVTRKRRNSKR